MSKVVDRKLLRKTEDVSFANNSLVDSETGDRCFTDTHFHRTGHSLHRRRSPVYAAQSRVDSVQVVDYHWSLETLKRWYILFVWQQSRLLCRYGRVGTGEEPEADPAVELGRGWRLRETASMYRHGSNGRIHVTKFYLFYNIILNKKIGFFFREPCSIFFHFTVKHRY